MDEADVLSLIVFNQPINQLGEGERLNLAQRAGSMAAGYIATPLANSIAEALDIDLVRDSAGGWHLWPAHCRAGSAIRVTSVRPVQAGLRFPRPLGAVLRISDYRAAPTGEHGGAGRAAVTSNPADGHYGRRPDFCPQLLRLFQDLATLPDPFLHPSPS